MEEANELTLAAEEELRRLELLIERHRLHITAVHPSRRGPEQRALQRMLGQYSRLRERRAVIGRRKTAA